ncbi:MAG: GNAT family N-acetyltransferase [Actinomycetota bacterium]|nr:GNAT family N-acetyltransferase [Actinomycetota bacterium]
MCIEHTPLIVTREGLPADFDRYFEEGFAALGQESRHMRFFTPVHDLPEPVLQRLRDIDGTINGAIIAFDAALRDDDTHPEGKPVGVARWMGSANGPPELSVTVIDEYQGRGVGSRMMDAMLVLGRKRGVRRMIADVLRENVPMRALINRYRAVVQPSGDPRIVRYRIDL